MKEKKKLKKLTLKKEAVVNLNDYEMNNLIGGSGWGCVSWAVASYVIGKSIDVSIDASINAYQGWNKSRNPDVNVGGWMSRDYFDGVCCISDVEVNC